MADNTETGAVSALEAALAKLNKKADAVTLPGEETAAPANAVPNETLNPPAPGSVAQAEEKGAAESGAGLVADPGTTPTPAPATGEAPLVDGVTSNLTPKENESTSRPEPVATDSPMTLCEKSAAYIGMLDEAIAREGLDKVAAVVLEDFTKFANELTGALDAQAEIEEVNQVKRAALEAELDRLDKMAEEDADALAAAAAEDPTIAADLAPAGANPVDQILGELQALQESDPEAFTQLVQALLSTQGAPAAEAPAESAPVEGGAPETAVNADDVEDMSDALAESGVAPEDLEAAVQETGDAEATKSASVMMRAVKARREAVRAGILPTRKRASISNKGAMVQSIRAIMAKRTAK